MVHGRTSDIFITHAWRYHPDWKRMVALLNAQGPRSWRNFSLPWYDPALDPRTPEGGRVVRWNLESQIIPAHAVLFLAGVWGEPGTRKWLEFELEMARKHRKLILAVPPCGETTVVAEVREQVDRVLDWNAAAILTAIEEGRTALCAAQA